ncbi:MAG: DUF4236 domain-containing protein [Lachnospiraceae bacterium]|jgi:hypothetical protein|nr:DUF4236 domain-containing protein [Lachnospiraceae bacterium]MCH4030883.1 DUF4236 domain-containing protein [Lachnospiraceae bacterium]MCH4070855.1 DUF4236 domain-containing protein [Lachnospiraceae bacterium]MCH4106969.1 DUF4236 domain-containing protein [Lachnospiraceae bacterium]MCI1302175.1 DUF4236 domain-containing protein [Lachnospiraceae bacterium]
MGMRYRKSINLGGGFRVNISKSGVGYSWGTKGYRYTKTARGTTRKTYSIPGTGLSYVEESGKKKRSYSGGNPQQQQAAIGNTVSTENVKVKDYQPAEYEELLGKMKKAKRLDYLSTWLIVTVIFAAYPLFIFTVIAGVILKVVVRTKMKVPMEYSFDAESQAAYENLSSIWMELNKNKKFWQTISESSLNRKTSGGASRGVNRISAKAINKLPFFIESDVQPFGLKLRRQKVYFLPDKILVVSKMNVGAIGYSDVDMGFGTTRFVETNPVPKDAKVIGHTWLKVNKNGTPDKRFKDNKQVPVCEYGEVIIKSGTGLHIELMCSNSETVREMRSSARRFAEFTK